ncbi:MAG: D-alanyl-D-alanine carboxypeptidase/D-alanyl-D-alanine-endopeptidase [Acidobacteriota bacterium]
MKSGPIRVSLTVIALIAFLSAPLQSATRKKKTRKTARKAPVVQAVTPAAQGSTLEERLASLMGSSVVRSSHASLEVVDVESGRIVAEHDSHTAVAPASNNKLFTTSAALDLLGQSFEFRTSVSLKGAIDASGTLHGDVKITGRGDPTIGGRFHDGNATAVIEQFADDLKAAGVRTIAGDLILEYGYFDTEFVHPSWPVNQLNNWYEAPIAALSMQEGTVMVRVTPGRTGGHAVVETEPPSSYMTVENSTSTRGGRGAFIGRRPGTSVIVVRGDVSPRSGATQVYVTVPDPLQYFAGVTQETFARRGVTVGGQVRLMADAPGDWKTISEHSTPLPVVIYVINKVSQNQYAEQLVKTLGAQIRNEGSWAAGTGVVEQWMREKIGVPAAEFDMADGSGMSRFNRASANAFTSVLRYMWKQPFRREFVSSMPYSGEPDSRLRRRLNQQPYARQVYAKTGYIVGVIGLSGYVHAQSGKIYAFSFLFNAYPSGVWGVYRLQDEMLKEIVTGG